MGEFFILTTVLTAAFGILWISDAVIELILKLVRYGKHQKQNNVRQKLSSPYVTQEENRAGTHQ